MGTLALSHVIRPSERSWFPILREGLDQLSCHIGWACCRFRRHTCSANISPFVKLGSGKNSDIFDSVVNLPVLSSIPTSYGFCFNLVTNLLLIRVAPQPVSNRIRRSFEVFRFYAPRRECRKPRLMKSSLLRFFLVGIVKQQLLRNIQCTFIMVLFTTCPSTTGWCHSSQSLLTSSMSQGAEPSEAIVLKVLLFIGRVGLEFVLWGDWSSDL
jgi:hypothetical protein